MNRVKSLFDVVPYYKYVKPTETLKESIVPRNNTNWVENLEILGKKGEKIVELYLKQKYSTDKVVKQINDSVGYDYAVDVDGIAPCIEVKTTYERKNHFTLSFNEAKVAKEKGDSYHIYFICLKSKNSGNIYVIENPFITLGLNEIFNMSTVNEIAWSKISSIEIKILDNTHFTTINDELSCSIIQKIMNDE